ncbi:hypothetical protein HanPSC8_Chr08g0313281 [Helianthus annuus]|nr:hypothetical protein HanPSC8_Chr08g0313281 [Helianthus annuus]
MLSVLDEAHTKPLSTYKLGVLDPVSHSPLVDEHKHPPLAHREGRPIGVLPNPG